MNLQQEVGSARAQIAQGDHKEARKIIQRIFDGIEDPGFQVGDIREPVNVCEKLSEADTLILAGENEAARRILDKLAQACGGIAEMSRMPSPSTLAADGTETPSREELLKPEPAEEPAPPSPVEPAEGNIKNLSGTIVLDGKMKHNPTAGTDG